MEITLFVDATSEEEARENAETFIQLVSNYCKEVSTDELEKYWKFKNSYKIHLSVALINESMLQLFLDCIASVWIKDGFDEYLASRTTTGCTIHVSFLEMVIINFNTR